MDEILTPEQVAKMLTMRMQLDGEDSPIVRLCRSHEALRRLCDSWQATAEESMDINVNKALAARHEMREASLKKQLAKVMADLDSLHREYVALHNKYSAMEARYAAYP